MICFDGRCPGRPFNVTTMPAFLGTLKVTKENLSALERLRCQRGHVSIRYASFYVRRDVLYVYMETEGSIQSDTLREAWGSPAFFMDARGRERSWETWAQGKGVVERGRRRIEI